MTIPLILVFVFVVVMVFYTSRLMYNVAVSNSGAVIEDRILNVSSLIDTHLNTAENILHMTADSVHHMLISGSTPVRIHEFLVDEQKSSYEKRVLQLEKDDANASNKAKSDFLANMSHEIRTPKHEVEFIIRGGSV